MRSYCAVHVDVGYLLASAATYVTGSSLRRGITVDYPTLIARLVQQAQSHSELPLLRVNWYDSGARPGGMPDYQQEAIGLLPRVKLRLGRLSYSGDQKGVDVRIGLDLAIQGRNRVADVVYLVSGDDDLTEAVEEAQSHGVQVILLAVPDQRGGSHGVSKHLRREVDEVLVIDPETISATVRSMAIPEGLVPEGEKGEEPAAGEGTIPAPETPADTTEAPAPTPSPVPSPAPSAPVPATPSPAVLARRKPTTISLPGGAAVEVPPAEDGVITAEVVDAVAKQVVASWCTTATPETLVALRAAQPTIPGELDRALLVDLGSRAHGADLDDTARTLLRERFWLHVGRVRME